MGLLIRALLIWLLVLAVPAQGAAAATMALCGPNHHGGGVVADVQLAAPAEHVHHPSGATTAHQHPQAAAQADEDSSVSASTAAATKVSQAGQHKCSACASCCSVGAILSSVLAVPAPVFTATVFSTVVPGVDSFAAEGPERPPRIVVA